MKNGVQLTSWEALGYGIESTTKKMLKFIKPLATNPLTWFLAIGAGAIILDSKLNPSLEKSKEKLEETQSKLSEVNSQIKENTNKIKELESLESLSITDEEDLKRLKDENKELEIRQAYLERLEELDKQQVVDSAKREYNQQYGQTGEKISKGRQLSSDIAEYKRYQDKKKQAESIEDEIKAGKAQEKWNNKLEKTEEKLIESRQELQVFKDELMATGASSEELDSVNAQLKQIDDLLKISTNDGEQLKEELQETSEINFSDILSTENTNKLSESIDKIQDAYKTLHSAIEEYNSEGAISVDTLQSVIALGDDWLDYLVDEQGNLKLDQEALQNLTASRLNDMRVQAINNVIDNASKVKDEITAKEYLASTNYALAESYEELAEKKLEDLKVSLAGSGLDSGTIDSVMSKASADISKINALFKNTNINSSSIIGGSSSSKSEKKWKDYLDKLLVTYEKELELGLVDFENFTNKSRDLIEKFYREGKISAEEYWDSINQLYENQLNIYDKVLNAVTRRIDKEIEGLKDEKDLLQDKINALNDEADAYELVRKKEEALYALEMAQRNRTKKLYIRGKGYVYDTDRDAIREAQNNLYDIKTEEVINQLKKEQDAIDKSIAVLEEYKTQWNDVADVYEQSVEDQYAAMILGKNWESTILNERSSVLNNFKNDYINIQEQIAQSALNSASKQVEAARISSEAVKTITANNQKIVEAQERKNSILEVKKYRVVRNDGTIMANGYKDAIEAYKYIADLEKWSLLKGKFKVEAYSKGGIVGSKKSPLDFIARQIGEDRVITAKDGERVLTPVQNEMWEKWTKALPNLQEFAKTINFTPNVKLPDYSHLSSMIQHQSQQPIVQNFNITMPNVTNNTSADRIMRDLQRLPLDAYQYSRKR